MSRAPKHRTSESRLLAGIWQSARDSAYAAGHGPEFDQVTSEIEAMRSAHPCASDAQLAALYSLAQHRRRLVESPPLPSLLSLPPTAA